MEQISVIWPEYASWKWENRTVSGVKCAVTAKWAGKSVRSWRYGVTTRTWRPAIVNGEKKVYVFSDSSYHNGEQLRSGVLCEVDGFEFDTFDKPE